MDWSSRTDARPGGCRRTWPARRPGRPWSPRTASPRRRAVRTPGRNGGWCGDPRLTGVSRGFPLVAMLSHSADPLRLLTGDRAPIHGSVRSREPVPTSTRSSSRAQDSGPVPILHSKIMRVPGHPPRIVAYADRCRPVSPVSLRWSRSRPRAGAIHGRRCRRATPRAAPPSCAGHPAGRAACRARARGTQRPVVEPVEQHVEGGERVDEGQLVAQLAAGREALEVPGDVLAELLAAPLLPHVLRQQLGVPAHHHLHLAERSGGSRRPRRGRRRPGRGRATAGPGSRGRRRRPRRRSARPSAARRRPPRCRRCRARGCRRGRRARRWRPSRPRPSRPAARCDRGGRSPRPRSPGRCGPASR